MALEPKKKEIREPTYGQERDFHAISMATDELAGVMRRSRDSAHMRAIIKKLHELQQEAAAALMED